MTSRILSYSLTFLIFLSLNGCVLTGNYKQRPTHQTAQKSFLQSSLTYFNEAEPVIAWWELLDDIDLEDLVYEAIRNNLDVKMARINIEKARAVVRAEQSRWNPIITTEANYKRERDSLRSEVQFGDRTSGAYQAGFDALWELDFFGRLTQRVEEAKALSEQLKADLQSLYVSIAAEVARYYIQLRGAQHQLAIANQNVDIQQKTFELIESMYKAGRATNLDVARAQAQLETTLSTIPSFEADIDTAIYRLSVLIGQEPTVLHNQLHEAYPLPSVPITVSIGDPEILLKRRPDIRSAEMQVQQAVNRYNLAVAEWFPKVDIRGDLGFLSTTTSELFTSDATFASVSPIISWKILRFKNIQAGVDEAEADIESIFISYQQTILLALEDVQSSMVRFSKEDKRRQRLRKAAKSSIEAAQIARKRFEGGLDNFLDVLDAEQRRLESENALAQSEIQTALNLIALYKSLGGGWEIVE